MRLELRYLKDKIQLNPASGSNIVFCYGFLSVNTKYSKVQCKSLPVYKPTLAVSQTHIAPLFPNTPFTTCIIVHMHTFLSIEKSY